MSSAPLLKRACTIIAVLSTCMAQAIVTKAQFEENLTKGVYSYQIQEFTKGERLAVGAWNGSRHPVLRWGATDSDEQRFVFIPIPGTNKYRIETLRSDVHDRVCLGIEDAGGLIAWPRTNDKTQQFELAWQLDTITLGIKEGTKGEFLDIAGNGNVVRWTGVDGKNDLPKSNQKFMLWNPRLESKAAQSILDQLLQTKEPFSEFIQNPYFPVQLGATEARLHINGCAITGSGRLILNYERTGGEKGDLYHWAEGEANWSMHTFSMHNKVEGEERYPSGMQALGDVVAVADNKYVNFFRVGASSVTEMPDSRIRIPSGNKEVVGMAYHPKHRRVYVVTMEGLYRSIDPHAIGDESSPTADLFDFERVKALQGMTFGEGGLALLYDPLTSDLICLSLGIDKAYALQAYKLSFDSNDGYSSLADCGQVTMIKPSTQGGDFGAGAGASFRWGATARVSSDGNLEIFAAPKRLDNVIHNGSKVLKWRLGPRFMRKP